MSPPFLRRRAEEPPPPSEHPDVRRYRYLLRTSPPGRLEAMHRRALELLDPAVRGSVLRTAQDRLLSGRDLSVDDTARIALLITRGEQRTPGILLAGLGEPALRRLARVMVVTNEASDVWEEYEAWDGVDPQPSSPVVRAPSRQALQEA
jgi:hypothetical protein